MNKDFNVYKWRRDNLTENEMLTPTLEDWKAMWDRHDKWYQMGNGNVYYAGQRAAEELHKVLMTLSPEDQETAKQIMTDFYRR